MRARIGDGNGEVHMNRARAINAFVAGTLSILLAGVFLLAGIPKLLGIPTVAIEAAAMTGFPTWIRMLAGLFEVAGAIFLLIPSLATAGAIGLACLMIPATFTQVASGESGVYVPLVLMAALLFLAWWRNSKTVSVSYHQFADVPHPLLHDGVIAGLIGASAIAVWFLIIDTIAGRAFFTPATLGHGLLRVLGPVPASDGQLTFVLVYSVFHFAAFMFVGLLASLVVFLAKKEPSILFAFIILFVATEVGIYGLVGLLDVGTQLGRTAWVQVMAANVIAAMAMGFYFWRTHRELADEFRHSLDWETPAEARESGVVPGQGADVVGGAKSVPDVTRRT
jgi:putative oxidoreductase